MELDDAWLRSLGYGALSDDDRASLLHEVQGELQARVGWRMAELVAEGHADVLAFLLKSGAKVGPKRKLLLESAKTPEIKKTLQAAP